MSSPLDPFAHELTRQVISYVIPATVLAGLIGLFKRDFESWIVKKLRGVFHPDAKVTQFEQEDMALDAPPACPKCRNTMVKRTSTRGLKRDSQFWGCSSFPRCRGTRDAG